MQSRFFHFNVWTSNVWTALKHVEKLRYMHRNPIKRGLALDPDKWPWSRFQSYAYGERGVVLVNAPGSAKPTVTAAAAG